jgi:hypothetical protein
MEPGQFGPRAYVQLIWGDPMLTPIGYNLYIRIN